MFNAKASFRSLAALTVILAAGCAPAYHSYSGCYIDCNYCVPPPLPYTHYEDCVCHSCAASPYLSLESQSVKGDTDPATAE